MFKNFIMALLATLSMALFSMGAMAATDINKATQAELESIKGIGPSMSTRMLDERKKGNFKSWDDLMTRVKGVKARAAAKFSKDGLTVNGEAFKGSTDHTTTSTKADRKTAGKKKSPHAPDHTAAP